MKGFSVELSLVRAWRGFASVGYQMPKAKGCPSARVVWALWKPTGRSMPNAVEIA